MIISTHIRPAILHSRRRTYSLAVAVSCLSASAQAQTEAENQTRDMRMVEEVVVTAQKRAEKLIDVPQAVTVLSADALEKLGATQLRDFADTVPALSFQTEGAGMTQVTLRGVTMGRDAGATVAMYVDEVPYGSSSAFARGSHVTLDAGLFDIDQIEVLRGPQGTLYGASTMGGLLKYVTKRPDASRLGFNVQTGLAGTQHGELSYHGAVALNAPIVDDKAALRASAYYSRDGGYIDNLELEKDDVNRSDIYGGRLDLLMEPTEALSIRLTGFAQDISRDGFPFANFTLAGETVDGSLEQRRVFAEPFDQQFRLGSAAVTYDLAAASLTSVSSYQTARTQFLWDTSPSLVPVLQSIGRPISAVGSNDITTTDKFTQEIRLASNESDSIEWLFGGFYTEETSENRAELVLRDLAGQPLPNDLLAVATPSRYQEYAVFGDLTWHLTDKFDVTGGVRYARNSQTQEQIGSGLLIGSRPTAHSKDDVVTYLANARYQINDHSTAYVRYATGYRAGGPNFATIDPTTGLPAGRPTFKADTLKSYEVGFKAETADQRFGMDMAGYYIDWQDVQLVVVRGGLGSIANALGGASIRGAELTLTARPSEAAAISTAFAYQDAELSKADPDLRAAKGEQLPTVPELTASLSADYELPLTALQPRIGATIRYVDDRTAGFGSTAYRLPEYTTVDLRTSFTLGMVDAQIYIRNITDERGQLYPRVIGAPRSSVQAISVMQPRTAGVTLSMKF